MPCDSSGVQGSPGYIAPEVLGLILSSELPKTRHPNSETSWFESVLGCMLEKSFNSSFDA